MIAPAALRRSAAEEELRLLQFFLGDAYDQVGRTEDARRLLEASRDAWMRYGPRTGQLMLLARQRWARFLLDHGAPAQAAAEFRAVLGDAHGVASAPAALASAGLARLALVRGDAAAADAASDQAVKTLDAITLGYDVRARIEVWSARAEALLARGRQPEARSWAVRAVAAADTYDAPGTVGPTRARALLARIDAGR
jgi:tetratricopeptide (TPR) repeat protein